MFLQTAGNGIIYYECSSGSTSLKMIWTAVIALKDLRERERESERESESEREGVRVRVRERVSE